MRIKQFFFRVKFHVDFLLFFITSLKYVLERYRSWLNIEFTF